MEQSLDPIKISIMDNSHEIQQNHFIDAFMIKVLFSVSELTELVVPNRYRMIPLM